MYNKLFKAKKMASLSRFGGRCGTLVFEQCVVSGNAAWKKNFLRLVDVLVRALEGTFLMHSATCSVRLVYEGATQDASDVYRICGSCGSLRSGPREWVRLNVSVVAAWPTLGLQSLRVYKPPKKRRGA